MANRMQRQLAPLSRVPSFLRPKAMTLLLGRVVPFLSTAGVRFEDVSPERVVVSIPNRKRAQNHIGGVHAAAMALLAETATGFALGMNIPDDKLPLIRSMTVEYVRRTQGGLRAVATFPEEARRRVVEQDKGDVVVPVEVTDESGQAPIRCTMTWAWVPKKR